MLQSVGLDIVEFQRKCQKTQFLYTQSPANPWIISFKTRRLEKMLHSVGLYHPAKNQKIYKSVSECQNNTRFLTFKPLLIPGLFFLKPDT